MFAAQPQRLETTPVSDRVALIARLVLEVSELSLRVHMAGAEVQQCWDDTCAPVVRRTMRHQRQRSFAGTRRQVSRHCR